MQYEMKSNVSEEAEPPTFADNWMALRRLFPKWTPTEEQAKIWFTSYDKPHGLLGPENINQTALGEAIRAHAKTSRWPDPTFLDVADAYRREQISARIKLDRLQNRERSTTDELVCSREAEERLERISTWSTARLIAARDEVGRRFRTLANKSLDPSAWTPAYTGMLVVVDADLQEDARKGAME